MQCPLLKTNQSQSKIKEQSQHKMGVGSEVPIVESTVQNAVRCVSVLPVRELPQQGQPCLPATPNVS